MPTLKYRSPIKVPYTLQGAVAHLGDPSRLSEVLRDLGGFPGAGLSRQDDDLVFLHALQDLLSERKNGQPLPLLLNRPRILHAGTMLQWPVPVLQTRDLSVGVHEHGCIRE